MNLHLTWIEIYELSHEWAKQLLQPWQHEHPVPNIHRMSNLFFISALDECYPKFIHRMSNIFFISALDECSSRNICHYLLYVRTSYLSWCHRLKNCHRLDRGALPPKLTASPRHRLRFVIVWDLSSSGLGGTPPKHENSMPGNFWLTNTPQSHHNSTGDTGNRRVLS